MKLKHQTIRRLLTVIFMMAGLFGGVSRSFAWSGSGTSSDPYLIKNRTDWNSFVNQLQSNSFSGICFKLTADIDIGDYMTPFYSGSRFKGTFDGNGHTIRLSVTGKATWLSLFRTVEDATIKNLRVSGSITNTVTVADRSSDYDNGKFTSGLVGRCYGNTLIENCIVSVAITSSIPSDGSHGGIVGQVPSVDARLTIRNCLFTGKLLGNTTTNCAGFVGAGPPDNP